MTVSVFLRGAAALALGASLAGPVMAGEKEDACKLQGDIMGAVQQARLDKVKKDDAAETVLEANPAWPEGLAEAMPQVVDFVYSQKKRDLKKVDLGETAEAQCLDAWDRIQAIQKG
ncbi:MAG: hypothetical protein ACU0BK_11890 [Shimia sp.]|jgi:hypothetical protein|uniref:hypothetical protein n=1 Tax=Shimia sp. TaxID=1954381 RepID=UPI00405808A4